MWGVLCGVPFLVELGVCLLYPQYQHWWYASQAIKLHSPVSAVLRMSSACPPHVLRMPSACPPHALRVPSACPPHVGCAP